MNSETEAIDADQSNLRRTSIQSSLGVALLSGLHVKARAHLRQAGIITLDQIVAMRPEDLMQFKGIKTTAHAIHASARAWVEQRPIWYGELPEPARQGGWIFDIETIPYSDKVWSIGWSDDQGNSNIVLVRPGSQRTGFFVGDHLAAVVVPTPENAWEVFADSVSGSDSLIYHWTNFDAGVMKNTAPEGVWTELNHRLHDLHGTFNHTVKFPIRSTSLKVVAAYLDFAYAEYERWDLAYRDYKMWLLRGDVQAIQRACAYQHDDVKATLLVWKWLVENAAK